MATPMSLNNTISSNLLEGCAVGDYSTVTGTMGDVIASSNYTTITNGTSITIGSGTGYIGSNTTWVTLDSRIVYGKEGDVIMDIENMKFKIFCEEKGWVEYELDDFATKLFKGKKKIILEGSRQTSISEIISERNKRKVLIEKTPKPSEPAYVNISAGAWTISGYNNYIPITYYNTEAIGTVSYAIGTGSVAVGASSLNDSYGTITITGNSNVNGNLKVEGDLTVNGTLTCSNITTS